MKNNLVENIRRIVKAYIEGVYNPLKDPGNQPSVGGNRGIGYQDSKSGGTNSASGKPGVTQSPDSSQVAGGASSGVGGGTGQAYVTPWNPSGSNGGSTNPSATNQARYDANGAILPGNDPSDPAINYDNTGRFDVADVLDSQSDRALLSAASLMNAGSAPASEWAVSGVDGWTDCNNTDLEGELRFDSYVPPIGWHSVTDEFESLDGNAEYWYQGYYWRNNVAGDSTTQYSDPMRAAIGGVAAYNASGVNPTYSVEAPISFAITDIDNQTVKTTWRVRSTGDIAFTEANTFAVIRETCGMSISDACLLTSAPAPANTKWPSDSKFQIKIIDGVATLHPNEPYPDIPLAYTSPTSTVYMCFDGRKASLSPGYGGTQIMYEVDPVTNAPLPDSQLHVYANNGMVLEVAPIADLDKWQPVSN